MIMIRINIPEVSMLKQFMKFVRSMVTTNKDKGKENFPDLKGQTRDIVASKLGIGSGKQ